MNFEIIPYPLLWRWELFGLFGHSYNISAWTTEEPYAGLIVEDEENDKSKRTQKGVV